jgi:hypothetical protein
MEGCMGDKKGFNRNLWKIACLIWVFSMSFLSCPRQENKREFKIFTNPTSVYLTIKESSSGKFIEKSKPVDTDTGYVVRNLPPNETLDISIKSRVGSESTTLELNTIDLPSNSTREIRIPLIRQDIRDIDTLDLYLVVDISNSISSITKIDTIIQEIYKLLLPNRDLLHLFVFGYTFWKVDSFLVDTSAQTCETIIDRYLKEREKAPKYVKQTTGFDKVFNGLSPLIHRPAKGNKHKKSLVILSDGIPSDTPENDQCFGGLPEEVDTSLSLLGSRCIIPIYLLITESDCQDLQKKDYLKKTWNRELGKFCGRCCDFTGNNWFKDLEKMQKDWGREGRVQVYFDSTKVQYNDVKKAFSIQFEGCSTFRFPVRIVFSNSPKLVDFKDGKRKFAPIYAIDPSFVSCFLDSGRGVHCSESDSLSIYAKVVPSYDVWLPDYEEPKIAIDYYYTLPDSPTPHVETVFLDIDEGGWLIRQWTSILRFLVGMYRDRGWVILGSGFLSICIIGLIWFLSRLWRSDLNQLSENFKSVNQTYKVKKLWFLTRIQVHKEPSSWVNLNLSRVLVKKSQNASLTQLRSFNLSNLDSGIETKRIKRFDRILRWSFIGLFIIAGIGVGFFTGSSWPILIVFLGIDFLSGGLFYLGLLGWKRQEVGYGESFFVLLIQITHIIIFLVSSVEHLHALF